MRKQPDKKGLRLGIKTSGCAGFGYVLEMIAEPAPDDLLFESDGRSCLRRCRRCRSSTAPSWIMSGKV
ncbi:iron binding protein SufA for iron-sulfur cluster assembly [Klebsiella pneumoniae]|uniref:Iron binding protein SufA for iron-sulfur cluster assembly n=1 Tax=Klebsiella pneumoniae TaxID=573 RepID=A0A447S7Q3_KLEPN|nr:iron binding protein SufA for iron-sulfur cluster assembly [Klebsiella pneumoniae]